MRKTTNGNGISDLTSCFHTFLLRSSSQCEHDTVRGKCCELNPVTFLFLVVAAQKTFLMHQQTESGNLLQRCIVHSASTRPFWIRASDKPLFCSQAMTHCRHRDIALSSLRISHSEVWDFTGMDAVCMFSLCARMCSEIDESELHVHVSILELAVRFVFGNFSSHQVFFSQSSLGEFFHSLWYSSSVVVVLFF